jgi:hypothetical protein
VNHYFKKKFSLTKVRKWGYLVGMTVTLLPSMPLFFLYLNPDG